MNRNDWKAAGVILLGLAGLAAIAAIVGKKKCKNCGYDNDNSAITCTKCGKRL